MNCSISISPATMGSRAEGHTQEVASLQHPTLCLAAFSSMVVNAERVPFSPSTWTSAQMPHYPQESQVCFYLEPSLSPTNISFCLFCSSITFFYALKLDLSNLCLWLWPPPDCEHKTCFTCMMNRGYLDRTGFQQIFVGLNRVPRIITMKYKIIKLKTGMDFTDLMVQDGKWVLF